jgi:hypothetical protein
VWEKKKKKKKMKKKINGQYYIDQVPTTSHLVIIDAFTFIGLWKKANIDCYVDLNHFDVFYMMFV